MINKQSYQILGMRQDNLVGTGTSNKFAHEIMNMRLNTIGDYTTASWTTEKGTKKIMIETMGYTDENNVSKTYDWLTATEVTSFKPLGQAVINDEWVLFGKLDVNDVILNVKYTIDASGTEHFYGRVLYRGIDADSNLGFDVNYPIETIIFYENEFLQKVYWTDGKNQPRMINIKGVENLPKGYNDDKSSAHNYLYNKTIFDFVQEVDLNETVEITKDQSGNGLFPPCTVKYVLTYYHKYGQETNIIYDSPLYYPTKGDRGCSPDELSGDSFVIKVKNLDFNHNFDYIRLYSIVKTSNDATPIVRIVADRELATLPEDSNHIKYALFIDTNTTGEIVDPSILNYIGGWNVTIGTFTTKDNVLFAGNITLKTDSLSDTLKEAQVNEHNLTSTNVVFSNVENKKVIPIKRRVAVGEVDTSVFPYINQLNSGNSFTIKSFKKGEYYRFGLQFQDSYGRWSEVLKLDNDSRATIQPSLIDNNSSYKLAYGTYTIPSSIRASLAGKYKKARLVCCYTNNADRSSILQGVINPTVYNMGERNDHVIDAMSSWFFRPRNGDASAYNVNDNKLQINRFIPWSSDEEFPNSGKSNAEIQSMSARYYSDDFGNSTDRDGFAKYYLDPRYDDSDKAVPGIYKVDNNILTLNSPELDFDESIRTLSLDSYNINIIGAIPINSFVSKYYVDAEAVGVAINDANKGTAGIGFVNKSQVFTNVDSEIISSIKGTHDIAAGYWDDIDVYENNAYRCGYPLYPFQRQGSLNNYMGDYDGTTESARLNSKVFATLMFSNSVEYKNPIALTLQDLQIYDSNESIPLKLDSKIYYGNMNSIIPLSNEEDLYIDKNGEEDTIYGHYKIYEYYPEDKYDLYGHTQSDGPQYDPYNEYNRIPIYKNSRFWSNTWGDGEGGVSSNPIPLTYKSTIHGVFNATQSLDIVLGNPLLPRMPYLCLVEMTRSGITDETRFGGKINYANIYTPCGPAETLAGTGDLVLYGLEGDHYFMRYDCLKTYPYTIEDTNQIVEILSFMCESRVNLDGRYDKNRGLTDNTMITNTNFNLINKSYTQDNNTLTFTTLDQLSAKLDEFPNQITWTKEKVSGEDIDAWTNITLASVADADGTLGKITKLTNFNDKLLLFQDHGLAQINYNENTAIPTEAGIPLELSKTGKFTGFNYLSKEVGCQNKWSVSQSKNGLFWIDDSRQELLAFAEGIKSLSTINGFDAFMINQLPSTFKPWNPNTFDNFVTYYDKLSNDVYYINNNCCLAWNEQSNTFTSFYNYEQVPYMVNIGQHSLMWKDGVWASREANTYSTFFGDNKDYWMTLVCDGITDKGSAFAADKVFNNIEYRADIYNLNGNNANYSNSIFNLKRAWNGYQDSQEVALDGIRKFNTWRVQLPRHYDSRDRIRNPFCYIKLKQDNTSLGRASTQTDRAIIHDLAVYFDMR